MLKIIRIAHPKHVDAQTSLYCLDKIQLNVFAALKGCDSNSLSNDKFNLTHKKI